MYYGCFLSQCNPGEQLEQFHDHSGPGEHVTVSLENLVIP